MYVKSLKKHLGGLSQRAAAQTVGISIPALLNAMRGGRIYGPTMTRIQMFLVRVEKKSLAETKPTKRHQRRPAAKAAGAV